MHAWDLNQLAAESANLLRNLRTHLPASHLVQEIKCPRCGRWVRPRRFDVLCMACRTCKSTLARPARRRASARIPRQRGAGDIPPAAWTRWDQCPVCDGTSITESRTYIDGTVYVVWQCRDCQIRTLWTSYPTPPGQKGTSTESGEVMS